jgi:hypothetical protein
LPLQAETKIPRFARDDSRQISAEGAKKTGLVV